MALRGLKRLLAGTVLIAVSAAVSAQSLLYWDSNLSDSGIGGSGVWSGLGRTWSADPAGIVCLLGSPSCIAHNGVTWPDLAPPSSAIAVFGGIGGNVSVEQPFAAAGLRFDVDGYQLSGMPLTLSSPGLGNGTLTVAAGATVRSTAQIGSIANLTVILDGPGTFAAGAPNVLSGRWSANSGTLRLEHGSAAASSFLFLQAGAQLQFSGTSNYVIGQLIQDAGHTIVLGDRALAIANTPALAGLPGLIGGRIEGSDLSRLNILNAKSLVARGGSVNVGSMAVANGAQVTLNGETRLTSTGSSLTGGSVASSLRLVGDSDLSVHIGGSLTAVANPQIEDSSTLTIFSGGSTSVLRPSGGFGTLRVGFANLAGGPGAVARVDVDGTLVVDDNIALGGTIGTNKGRGNLRVQGGGTVLAPVLSFVEQNSSLELNAGGTARFAAFDSRPEFNQPGTITINGGTLVLGDTSLTSALLTNGRNSTFAGTLTGAAAGAHRGGGLIRKRNHGHSTQADDPTRPAAARRAQIASN